MARKSLTESTQKLRVSKGGLVGDSVSVGFVGVGLGVVVEVAVDEGVALAVAVKGSGVGVHVGEATGVGVGGGVSVPGLKMKNSRMMIPRMAGMAYRVQGGRDNVRFLNGVTAGGSPVYPMALRSFLKLSSYPPVAKFR